MAQPRRRGADASGADLRGLLQDFAIDGSMGGVEHPPATTPAPTLAPAAPTAPTPSQQSPHLGPSVQAASAMSTPSRQHLYRKGGGPPASAPPSSPSVQAPGDGAGAGVGGAGSITPLHHPPPTPDAASPSMSPIDEAKQITEDLRARLDDGSGEAAHRPSEGGAASQLTECVLRDTLSQHFDNLNMRDIRSEYPKLLRALQDLERENKALRAESRLRERDLYRALNGEEPPWADPQEAQEQDGKDVATSRLQRFKQKKGRPGGADDAQRSAPRGKVAAELSGARESLRVAEERSAKLAQHLEGMMHLQDEYREQCGDNLLLREERDSLEIAGDEASAFAEITLQLLACVQHGLQLQSAAAADAEERIGVLGNEVLSLSEEAAGTRAELDKWMEDHVDERELKRRSIALAGEVESRGRQVAALEDELRDATRDGVGLREQLAKSEGKCDILEHEVHQLTDRLAEMSSLVSDAERRLADGMLGLSSHSEEVRALDSLADENTDLKLRNEYLAEVVGAADKKETELQRVCARNAVLEEQNRALEERMRRYAGAEHEGVVPILQEELTKLNGILKQEHPSRQAIHEAVDSLTQEHARLLHHSQVGRSRRSPSLSYRGSPTRSPVRMSVQMPSSPAGTEPSVSPPLSHRMRRRSATSVSFARKQSPLALAEEDPASDVYSLPEAHSDVPLAESPPASPIRLARVRRRSAAGISGLEGTIELDLLRHPKDEAQEEDSEAERIVLQHLKASPQHSPEQKSDDEGSDSDVQQPNDSESDRKSEGRSSYSRGTPRMMPFIQTSGPDSGSTPDPGVSEQLLREAGTCLLDVTEPQEPPAHRRARARTTMTRLPHPTHSHHSHMGHEEPGVLADNYLTIKRERSLGDTSRSFADTTFGRSYADSLGRSFADTLGSPDAMSSPSMLSSPRGHAPGWISPRGKRRMRKRSSTVMVQSTDFDAASEGGYDNPLFLTHSSGGVRGLTRQTSSPLLNLLCTTSNHEHQEPGHPQPADLPPVHQSKVYRNLEWHRLFMHYNEGTAAEMRVKVKQETGEADTEEIDDAWLREHTPYCVLYVRQLRHRMQKQNTVKDLASPDSPQSPLTLASSTDEEDDGISEQLAVTEKALCSAPSALSCERQLISADMQETRTRLLQAVQQRLSLISQSHHQNGLESSHLMSIIYALLIGPESLGDAESKDDTGVASPLESTQQLTHLRQSSTGSLTSTSPRIASKASFSLPRPVLTHSSKENPALITATFSMADPEPATIDVNLRSSRCIFIRRAVSRDSSDTPSRPFFFKIREREFIHLQALEATGGVMGEVFLPLVALSGTSSGMVCEVVLSLSTPSRSEVELKLLLEGAVLMGCEAPLTGCTEARTWGDMMAAQNAVAEVVNEALHNDTRGAFTFFISRVRLLRSDGHCERLIYDMSNSEPTLAPAPSTEAFTLTRDGLSSGYGDPEPLEVVSIMSSNADEFVPPPARLASEGLESELDATTAQGELPSLQGKAASAEEEADEEEEEETGSSTEVRTERQSSLGRKRSGVVQRAAEESPLIYAMHIHLQELTASYDALSEKVARQERQQQQQQENPDHPHLQQQEQQTDPPPQSTTASTQSRGYAGPVAALAGRTAARQAKLLCLRSGFTSLLAFALQRRLEREREAAAAAAEAEERVAVAAVPPPQTPPPAVGVSYVGAALQRPSPRRGRHIWACGSQPDGTPGALFHDTAEPQSQPHSQCHSEASSREAPSSVAFCAFPDAFDPQDVGAVAAPSLASAAVTTEEDGMEERTVEQEAAGNRADGAEEEDEEEEEAASVRLSPVALREHEGKFAALAGAVPVSEGVSVSGSAGAEEEEEEAAKGPRKRRGGAEGANPKCLHGGVYSGDSSLGSMTMMLSDVTSLSLRGDQKSSCLQAGEPWRLHGGVVVAPSGQLAVVHDGCVRHDAERRGSVKNVSFDESFTPHIITPVASPTVASESPERIEQQPSVSLRARRVLQGETDIVLCVSDEDVSRDCVVVTDDEVEDLEKSVASVRSAHSAHSAHSNHSNHSNRSHHSHHSTGLQSVTSVDTTSSQQPSGTVIAVQPVQQDVPSSPSQSPVSRTLRTNTKSMVRNNSFSSPRRRQPPRQLHMAQPLAPLPKSMDLFDHVTSMQAALLAAANATPPSPSLAPKRSSTVIQHPLARTDEVVDIEARCLSPSAEIRRASTAEPRMPTRQRSLPVAPSGYDEFEGNSNALSRSYPGPVRPKRIIRISLVKVRVPLPFCGALDALHEGAPSNLFVGLRMEGRGTQFLDCGALQRVPRGQAHGDDYPFVDIGWAQGSDTPLSQPLGDWSRVNSPPGSMSSNSPVHSPMVSYEVPAHEGPASPGNAAAHVVAGHKAASKLPCEVYLYKGAVDVPQARFLVGSGFFVIDIQDCDPSLAAKKKEIHAKVRFVPGVTNLSDGVLRPDSGQRGSLDTPTHTSSSSSPKGSWYDSQKGDIIFVVENMDEQEAEMRGPSERHLVADSRTGSIAGASDLGSSLPMAPCITTPGTGVLADLPVMPSPREYDPAHTRQTSAASAASAVSVVSAGAAGPPVEVGTVVSVPQDPRFLSLKPDLGVSFVSTVEDMGADVHPEGPLWPRQRTDPVLPTLMSRRQSLVNLLSVVKQASVACDCPDLVALTPSEAALCVPYEVPPPPPPPPPPPAQVEVATEMSLLDSFELSVMVPRMWDVDRELLRRDAGVNTTLALGDIVSHDSQRRLVADRTEAQRQAASLLELLDAAQQQCADLTSQNNSLRSAQSRAESEASSGAAAAKELEAAQESVKSLEGVLEEVCLERDRDVAALREELDERARRLREVESEVAVLKQDLEASGKRLHDALAAGVRTAHSAAAGALPPQRSPPRRERSESSSSAVLSSSPDDEAKGAPGITRPLFPQPPPEPSCQATLSYSPSTASDASPQLHPVHHHAPLAAATHITPLGGAADEYTLAKQACVDSDQLGYFRRRLVDLLCDDDDLAAAVSGVERPPASSRAVPYSPLRHSTAFSRTPATPPRTPVTCSTGCQTLPRSVSPPPTPTPTPTTHRTYTAVPSGALSYSPQQLPLSPISAINSELSTEVASVVVPAGKGFTLAAYLGEVEALTGVRRDDFQVVSLQMDGDAADVKFRIYGATEAQADQTVEQVAQMLVESGTMVALRGVQPESPSALQPEAESQLAWLLQTRSGLVSALHRCFNTMLLGGSSFVEAALMLEKILNTYLTETERLHLGLPAGAAGSRLSDAQLTRLLRHSPAFSPTRLRDFAASQPRSMGSMVPMV